MRVLDAKLDKEVFSDYLKIMQTYGLLETHTIMYSHSEMILSGGWMNGLDRGWGRLRCGEGRERGNGTRGREFQAW